MIVLAIDTSLDACSVALDRDGETCGLLCETMTRGQAERIAPMVQETLRGAAISPDEIDRTAVAVGPGSFTGVRVGLAFARGWALALGKPCIGVSTLEALALETGEDGLRGGVIETPGALYAALYEDGLARIAPMRFDARETMAPRFAEAASGRPMALRGPGVASLAALILNAQGQDAACIDVAALARRAAALDPAHYRPRPLYLRAALIETP